MWHFILVLDDVCYAVVEAGPSLIESAVYSNSVLATLNARQAIRELGEDSENLSFSLQPTFLKSGPGFNSNVCTSVSTTQCVPRYSLIAYNQHIHQD